MVKLEIILNDNGTLSMSGPIDNLYMCYGMMELAKDVLRERHKANQQKIQKVGPQELLEFGGKRS